MQHAVAAETAIRMTMLDALADMRTFLYLMDVAQTDVSSQAIDCIGNIINKNKTVVVNNNSSLDDNVKKKKTKKKRR